LGSGLGLAWSASRSHSMALLPMATHAMATLAMAILPMAILTMAMLLYLAQQLDGGGGLAPTLDVGHLVGSRFRVKG
jgi:hypothetical protein